jgi:putative ABC transport system permease protein
MDEHIAGRIAAVPGIASVEPFRVVPLRLAGRPVYLQGISVDDRLAHGGLAMVEGDLPSAAESLRKGTGILVSENLAYRLGLHRDDELTVPTPQGPRRFRIEGLYIDYLASLDLGAVAVDYRQLGEVWGDRSANLFRVWLAPGASASAVRSAVLVALGPGFYAITSAQFLHAVQDVLHTLFLATWALVFVAAFVGVIGVVNAQLAAVLDRTTEIATLRTIGLARTDITRGVLAECATLGLLGGLCGLAMGAMLSRQMVTVDLTLVTGWRVPFVLGITPLLGAVGCAAIVSALAGYVPARAAARLQGRQRSFD